MQRKHVHLIGVAGTGMGSLAGLLRKAGHRVTGSDTAFYPPMGDKLVAWGVETRQGFDASHVADDPDLVVVGNVCRRDNPEARAAIDRGLPYLSMPAAIETLFLQDRRSLVIAGTHGKTTTTALTTFLLSQAGEDPGFLLGGVPQNFPESFATGRPRGPFVIEGDEYDSAFFEKQPKFWRYRPHAAILTSVEHDHIDIYPTEADYLAAFECFVSKLDPQGVLIAYAGDPHVRALAQKASCRVCFYALKGEATGGVRPAWEVAMNSPDVAAQPLELFREGTAVSGCVLSPLSGAHNARNTLAAIALCAEGMGVSVDVLTRALPAFRGVKRRQERVAIADGVTVYDDFAHHPTAVRETLRGLRARHPEGKLVAVFEPRSATASRNLHQHTYPEAFEAADVALIAPVGRPEIDASERLDVAEVARAVCARLGPGRARAVAGHDTLLAETLAQLSPGDTLIIMSNGDFQGFLPRMIAALEARTEGATR